MMMRKRLFSSSLCEDMDRALSLACGGGGGGGRVGNGGGAVMEVDTEQDEEDVDEKENSHAKEGSVCIDEIISPTTIAESSPTTSPIESSLGCSGYVQQGCSSSKRRCFSLQPLAVAVNDINFPPTQISEEKILQLFSRFEAGRTASGERCISGDRLVLLEQEFGWSLAHHSSMQSTYFVLRFCMQCDSPNVPIDINCISQSQWLRTFCALRVDTLEDARRVLLDYQFRIKRDREMFRHLFHFVFRCISARSGQKCIDIVLAQKGLISVVGSYSPFTFSFCQFLTESAIRGMSCDQWRNFLPFTWTIHSDFSNYNSEDSWPTVYDSYVEWVRAKGVMFNTTASNNCSADTIR